MPSTEADRLNGNHLRALGCALVLFMALCPAHAAAQVRRSELASVSQTVDGTVITIEYSRPVARGRTLFGGLVKWGERWTPGANWATTLETNREIELNGHAVPKGKYSVWMIPEQGEWTVYLSDKDRVFHTQRQRPEEAFVRFMVQPEDGTHMEALAWYFPSVSRDGATLRMHWGTVVIPLTITVEPTPQEIDTSRDLTPMLGSYTMRFEGDAELTTEIEVDVYENRAGRLRGRFIPAPPDMDSEFELIAVPDQSFTAVYYEGGVAIETDQERRVVFLLEAGRVTGFEMRFGTEVYGYGRRSETR
jgi:hypothetical protein